MLSKILPKTKLGKWSVSLIAAMPLLLFIGRTLADTLYKDVVSGNSFISDLLARPVLVITMLMGSVSGVVSFIFGLIAVIKHKERGWLIYPAILLGGFLVFLLSIEIFFEH